jgi:uncharacterized protein (TIGR02001 family)
MSRMCPPRLFASAMLALLAPLSCYALSGVPDSIGGSVALTSDYVYHGISESCGHPAAQLDVHFRTAPNAATPEAFIGAWGSVDPDRSSCRTADELNGYLGLSWMTTRDSSARVTYMHFAYFGEYGHIYDYDELESAWAYQDRLFVTLAWTPDTYRFGEYGVQRDRSAFSYGVQLHQAVGRAFTLSAGVGYDEIADPTGTGYGFWDAGVGYTFNELQLDVTYFDTAARATHLFGGSVGGGRFAATVVWRF